MDPGADDAVLRHFEFLTKYQAKAPSEGVDPLGWYLPPFAYANLQVLGDAIEGAKNLDQGKLADYIRSHPFKTIVGEITFGKDGEWSKPRVLEVQWQNIKSNNLDEFKDTKTEVILEPDEYRTGTVVAPIFGQRRIGKSHAKDQPCCTEGHRPRGGDEIL